MSLTSYVKEVYGDFRNTFTERDAAAYISAYARFHGAKAEHAGPVVLDGPERRSEKCDTHSRAVGAEDHATHAAHAELMGELYKNLDTLDGKASGLLTYCGLILAGSSFLVTRADASWIAFLSVVVVALAAISALFAVQAIFLSWTPATKLADPSVGAEEACIQYYRVRQRRTRFYLVSWLAITVTTLLFLACLIAEYIDDATDLFESEVPSQSSAQETVGEPAAPASAGNAVE